MNCFNEGNFMKRFIKSPMVWMLLLEVIIIVTMVLLGFKITYAPSLDNNWDAITAIASWVSSIATIFIPIVVVFFQHKLEQNKSDISDANKATLLELKKFKDTYSELFEAIKNGDEIILDGGTAFLQFSEQNLIDYIQATISVTAYDVAMYFGVDKKETVALLDELVERKLVVRTDVDGTGVYSIRK